MLESELETAGICTVNRFCTAPDTFLVATYTSVDFRIDSGAVVVVDDIEEVGAGKVDADLLDIDLSAQAGRNCVTECDILQTEVCHIDKILGLRVEVISSGVDDATGDSALAGSAREHCRECCVLVDIKVGNLLCGYVADLVRIDGIYTTHERHDECGLVPYTALAYTLEIEVKVESHPVSSDAE